MRVRLEVQAKSPQPAKARAQQRKRPPLTETSSWASYTSPGQDQQHSDYAMMHNLSALTPYAPATAQQHTGSAALNIAPRQQPIVVVNTTNKGTDTENQLDSAVDVVSSAPWQLLEHAAHEPAQPLPYRADLERQVGQSLADVAVYTNPLARLALALLGARAATYNRQVFLADPHPEPELLLHEVIHTIQAERGASSITNELVAEGDPAEREAEHLSERARDPQPPPDTAQTRTEPLSVRVGLPRHAIALRRSSSSSDRMSAPDPAASAAFNRNAARPPTPAPTSEPTTPDTSPAQRESVPAPDGQAAAPLLASSAAEPALDLPPPPEPGLSPEDAAAQAAATAEAEAALTSAENPRALMAAFAAAPPTVKARRAATIQGDLATTAQQEEQTFQTGLPEFRARLNSQVEPTAPLRVETPAAETTPLETLPPPAPEPDIPPTPDTVPYTANDSAAANITRTLGGNATNRAGQIGDQLRDVRTNDPDIATSPGLAPSVPLEGANDPQRIDNQAGTGVERSRQARDRAQQAVLSGPGPEQVQPRALDETHPISELAQPTIEAAQPPAEPQQFLEMGLPPEVHTAFDQQQQGAMQQSMEAARSQVDQATTERDQQRETAVTNAEREARTLSEQADADQRAQVREQRGTIQRARQETLNSQTAAVRNLEQDVSTRRSNDRRTIGDRVRRDEARIGQRYSRAETDARSRVRAGERDAERERDRAEREAKDQSWWDRAVNFVANAFRALASAINTIFDAVRRAVNALLDAAKAFAQQLIDAAARFINAAIAAFGTFLKGLVDGLLGDIFPGLAAALNRAIDAAVALAQSAVNRIAAGLKAGIAALVNGLKAGLNAIINFFQGALQTALSVVQAALTGDWAALARMALEAVLRVAGIEPASFYQFIGRSMETFQLILNNPGGFVGNLVNAFLNGVRSFASNFLRHLQAGIIGWLTGAIGGAGITIPQRFDLMGVLSIIQQILGLTWDRLRVRAVRLLGERAVAVLEFVTSYLQTLIQGGWAALWERIQGDLASVRDMVLDGIKNFLVERIVMAAITRLATMFNPVGAIVNLILAAYNLFTFLRDQLQRIIQVVQTVISAISDIARGVIQPAAQRVEEVLARLLPLAIDLLARLLGLGNVGARVRQIIERVRGVVDRAIDRLIARVRRLFRGDGARGAAQQGAARTGARRLEDQPFRLGRERHTLRARLTGRRLTIVMASNGWMELVGRIDNIRKRHITGLPGNPATMRHAPSLANKLDTRLKAIEQAIVKLMNDVAAEADEQKRIIITNKGLDKIEGMFALLGQPPFMIETEGKYKPPTHRYSPVSTDSYGRAKGALGDPISSASRGQGSPASADPPGIYILRDVTAFPTYERGHLLAGTSDKSLGGPGNDLRNLVPISPSTNTAMRDGPERMARDAIYDTTVHPPNMLRYVVRCHYRAISGLENWLTGTLGAAAGSSGRLYALARTNTDLTDSNVHTALGGAAQLPSATVTANLDAIRKQLAYYFMTHRIDIGLQSLQGTTTISPSHPINNHQGVTLP